jgi:hypothetical protein
MGQQIGIDSREIYSETNVQSDHIEIGHLFKSLQGELAQVITDKGTYHDF